MKCLIVDANAAHKLFTNDEVGLLIIQFLVSGRIRLATGGRHKKEILLTKIKLLYKELLLAGRIVEYSPAACDALEEKHEASGALTSDDPHIIALAELSGCRLLFSYDDALCADFKNKKILDKPRGKIIRKADQALISRSCPCNDP